MSKETCWLDLQEAVRLAEIIHDSVDSKQFRLDAARVFLAASTCFIIPLISENGKYAEIITLIFLILFGAFMLGTLRHINPIKKELRRDRRALKETFTVLAQQFPPNAQIPNHSVLDRFQLRVRLERINPDLASKLFPTQGT